MKGIPEKLTTLEEYCDWCHRNGLDKEREHCAIWEHRGDKDKCPCDALHGGKFGRRLTK